MLENKEKNVTFNQDKDDLEIHNLPSDKIMVIACACLSGMALFSVSFFVLHYKWYFSVLYFVGMFVWVVLFFEYFNYSLFRNQSDIAKK